jgi:oligosaccharyltransferase complex subunit beta
MRAHALSGLCLGALLCALACATPASAAAAAAAEGGPAGKRLLVLHGDPGVKHTHSQFFKALSARGFSLDFKGVKEAGLKLRDHDRWLYDGLVLFAPKATSEFCGGRGRRW